MKYKFIVLEGVDGSGKSTLCNWISTTYGYKQFKSIGNTFSKVKTNFAPDVVSVEERFSFLCGDAINNAFIVKEHLNNNQPIIFDRYFYSTLVYCESLQSGVTNDFKFLFDSLPKPDLTLFIDTKYEKMLERLSQRESTTFIEEYFSNEEKFNILLKNYKNVIDSKLEIIDNNDTLNNSFLQIDNILK